MPQGTILGNPSFTFYLYKFDANVNTKFMSEFDILSSEAGEAGRLPDPRRGMSLKKRAGQEDEGRLDLGPVTVQFTKGESSYG